jgi:hypothetical protein
MWEVTMRVGTLLLVILASGLVGAVSMVILITSAVNRSGGEDF